MAFINYLRQAGRVQKKSLYFLEVRKISHRLFLFFLLSKEGLQYPPKNSVAAFHSLSDSQSVDRTLRTASNSSVVRGFEIVKYSDGEFSRRIWDIASNQEAAANNRHFAALSLQKSDRQISSFPASRFNSTSSTVLPIDFRHGYINSDGKIGLGSFTTKESTESKAWGVDFILKDSFIHLV